MLKWSCKVSAPLSRVVRFGAWETGAANWKHPQWPCELRNPSVTCSVSSPRQRLRNSRCLGESRMISQIRQNYFLTFSVRKLTDYFYFIYLRSPSSGQLLMWHIGCLVAADLAHQLLPLYAFQIKLLMDYFKDFRKRTWDSFRWKFKKKRNF